jgi:hypothetical protein
MRAAETFGLTPPTQVVSEKKRTLGLHLPRSSYRAPLPQPEIPLTLKHRKLHHYHIAKEIPENSETIFQ